MDTVKEYVTHVSTQLNDQRPGRAFTRWGRDLLLEYLNLALTEISTYRPEAFSNTIDITLVAGALQTLSQNESLISLLTNADGSVVNKGDASMAAAFSPYKVASDSGVRQCNGTATYGVRSYSIDVHDGGKFYVDPPVPTGLTPIVKGSIYGSPATYTVDDWTVSVAIQPKFSNDLIDFMLACAYALDQESPTSLERSTQLYAKFYSVMGVKYKQESKFRSGYYLGKTGTGDPQAGSR